MAGESCLLTIPAGISLLPFQRLTSLVPVNIDSNGVSGHSDQGLSDPRRTRLCRSTPSLMDGQSSAYIGAYWDNKSV